MDFKLSPEDFEYIDPCYLERLEDARERSTERNIDTVGKLGEMEETLVRTEQYVQDLRSDLLAEDPRDLRDREVDELLSGGETLVEIYSEAGEDGIYDAALETFAVSLVAASYNSRAEGLEDPVEKAWGLEGPVYESFPGIMNELGVPYSVDENGSFPLGTD